jgi:hypothetical protein
MLKIILTAGIGVIVARAAFRGDGLRENLAIIAQYRLRHLLAGLLTGAVVAATAIGLIVAAPSVFARNPVLWVISEIFRSGSGNGQGNLIFTGVQTWKWYAVVFLPVLALALPRLARREEVKYRAGTRDWRDGCLRSLRFGLVHMIMLIPFGASLALTWGGLLFTWAYFRGGTEASTLYHAAFNTVLVTVLFVAVLISF